MLKRYINNFGLKNLYGKNRISRVPIREWSTKRALLRWWNTGREGDPVPLSRWGYNGSECDPVDWPKHFKCGSGLCQSPINIDMSTIQYSKDLAPIKISYKTTPSYLINDGQAIRVHYAQGSVISGANLENEYGVVQFHFHWGSKNGCGSEHLIDNEQADAELHIVHMNTKYSDIFQAMEHDDGLAVLGIFLREDAQRANDSVKPITQQFSRLTNFNHHYKCEQPFDLSQMVPDLTEFLTYDGSLTTPPLTQVSTN